MDLSTIAGVLPFEYQEIPTAVIAALPEEHLGDIHRELRTLELLESMETGLPGSPSEVVSGVARSLLGAARAGNTYDVLKESSKAIEEHDARSMAAVAVRLAIATQRNTVADLVREAVPGACAVWTKRVQEIAARVHALMGEGVDLVTDELEARRAGGATLKRWTELSALLAEYGRLREGWLEARYLVNPSDQDRFTVSAWFVGRLDGDDRDLKSAMELLPEPLMAAVSLGWIPWTPTLTQQTEERARVLKERKESRAAA